MKIISKITLLFCLLVSTLALAEQALAAEPRIGLVLSGGGARGLAHIGVLRALEEQGVRVHAIAGTSMGAIVGALYASGRSPDELEEIALSLNWAEAFADQPTRDKLSFRRKQDSRDYLVKTQATLKGGVVSLPKGVIQGQNLQLILQRQFFHVSDITDFDKLPIPFRAVASDLVTGEPVVFSGGSLATAVRASMSIPGLFAPVELDGKVLIDGGVANNLPVDIVKAMGVDYVIAVDIATPLYSAEQLDSVVPIIEQLTTLLTFNQQRKQYALLTEDDLLISPQLDDINTAAFERTRDAITRGYLAASEFRSALARYSAGSTAAPAADAAFDLPVITEITIDNDSQVSDKLIAANIHQPLNEPLNAALLERDMEIIYGYSYFEAANYEIHPLANGYQLRIVTTEKSWGRDLLGVSFELSTDNEGESGYNIGVNYRKTGVTLKGGEWFNVLQLGQDPLVRSELYLPLDYNQRFYLEPYIRYSERSFNNVVDGEISSRFRIDQLTAGTELGTEISNLAILAIGAEYHTGNTDTFVGPGTSTDEFRDSVTYFTSEYDTLDNLYFPNSGSLWQVKYSDIRPRDSAAPDFRRLDLNLMQAISLGSDSVLVNGRFVRSDSDLIPRHFQSALGGLKNLSGLHEQALVGNDLFYGSLTYLRRLDEQSILPVDLPVYFAVSLEAGNTWMNRDDISFGDLIYGGALILGVDSPVGPVYIGYGRAESNQSSIYLKLGRIF